MSRLRPEEQRAVVQYIYSLCGVVLDESKTYLIEGRLGPIMREAGCASFTDLLSRSKSDASGKLKRRIIDEITTHETQFFRDGAPFELLRHKLIPELVDRRSKTSAKPAIRIWSAACSTGQEIYTVAIVLKQLLGNLSRYNVRLLGTDISDEAVSRASEGVFSAIETARGLSNEMRSMFFTPHPRGWKISDEIRSMASFRKLNLLEDFSSLGKFDIIFCRNVAIYFNERDRSSLFNRMADRLESDGALIIGSMESLSGVTNRLQGKHYVRSVVYQRT